MGLVAAVGSLGWFGAGGCMSSDGAGTTPYVFDLPVGYPRPKIPESNPMTVEAVELGRHLFYDRRLSANTMQSCGDCHPQATAFADGIALAEGSTGHGLPRNTQGLTNVAYASTLTWGNPLLEDIEQQVLIPIFGEDPIELGASGNEEQILSRLRDDSTYQALFEAAFPDESDPVDFDHVARALASFSRSIVSSNSGYDRFYYRGDPEGMSESALRGEVLFNSERFECHHCHGGFNFSVASKTTSTSVAQTVFTNTGLYNLDGEGAYPPPNTGLFEFTGEAGDMGKFRPPSLRNVALTGPYGHDGSIETLDDVLDIYADAGRNIEDGPLAGDGRENPHKSEFVIGFELSDQDRADVRAFLDALTDESLTSDPALADPWESD